MEGVQRDLIGNTARLELLDHPCLAGALAPGRAASGRDRALRRRPRDPVGHRPRPRRYGLDTRWIDHTLLPDYTIPGVLLMVVIGGGMALAAAATALRPRIARPVALAMALVVAGLRTVHIRPGARA
jgi:hypothetical protein